ncbi:hypothetical protein B0H98_108112 [Vreelandella songnenensis]|uniref:Haloacid dehalogenase-like hydrolase n=1 Tax=Vreelandella songnenensis TaxID=1176243 RepID=A0A2T0V079_9GAMM|nr:hypothetical protein [Halomonas songnenensis]PRY63517.1 hypothetical protein B0H98_108112 [Halomonas songnenensis]
MKAILFDVFGTVVDWRSSLIQQFSELELGFELPKEALTDQWRQCYAPSMDRVRKGELPWTILDDLHRESLNQLLDQHAIALDEATIDKPLLAPAGAVFRRTATPRAAKREVNYRNVDQWQRLVDGRCGSPC